MFISQLVSQGVQVSGEELEQMRKTFLELYGLDKPLIIQYLLFLKNYAMGNMGPSFTNFPTPVNELIAKALPWTMTLLMTALLINWTVGNVVGVWAAMTKRRRLSAALEYVAVGMQPIPFAVLALAFLILYALVLRLPLTTTGYIYKASPLELIAEMFRRAALPATVLVAFGWIGSFLSMKNIALKMKQDDFVVYMMLQGAPSRTIRNAVFRNSLIPQYTFLILGISRIFIGSVLVEYLFNYPGIGLLLRDAVANGDYNLMLGIVFMSVFAVGLGAFILDLTYPLIDPRIRYPGAG